MISILGTVAQMERTQLRERQMKGIHVAKAKGIYKGRAVGSIEKTDKFLSKEKNKKALAYLKKGYTAKDAADKAGVNKNTITKIIKMALPIAKAD